MVNPAKLQGLDITLNVNGANAADLFPLTGIALPPTSPYSLTGRLDFKNDIWTFNDFKGKMGSSDLGGNLSFDKSRARPLFTAKFISKSLNFKDLGGLIGAPPPKELPNSKLTAEQKAKQAKLAQSPYVIPDAPLDISRLKAMDANVEFTGTKIISPSLPLDDFYLHVTLDNLLLKIKPVKFGTAGGDIIANLEINARKEPVKIDSDFQFKKLQLSRLFEKMPVGNNSYNTGYIGGTARLKGTGKSLRQMLATSDGAVGVGMEGGELSNLLVELMGLDVAESLGFAVSGDKPVTIRCVIGDFDVRHGLMQSKAIIADTNDTNVKGMGTINLANEQMNLRLEARPKDPSLFSLKSPITIGGTLKKPAIGIEPGNLLVRSGVAAVASVVLTPVVGALAFIEPGLGKDSNCAKLIRDMDEHTGKSKSSSGVPVNKNAPAAASKPAKKAGKLGKAPVVAATPAMAGTSKPGQ